MKKLLIPLLLLLSSTSAFADTWNINVTMSYPTRNQQTQRGIQVIKTTLPVGKCADGVTRTEPRGNSLLRIRQEICVYQSGDRTLITGWVFSSEKIWDFALTGEEGATGLRELNFGVPVRAEVLGKAVSYSFGFYELTAERLD